MLMVQMLLVALAEITEFNITFIAVTNILYIYCHIRNTLKHSVGKTVDEFFLRWNNKRKTIFRNCYSNRQYTPNYLQEQYSSALNHVSIHLLTKYILQTHWKEEITGNKHSML